MREANNTCDLPPVLKFGLLTDVTKLNLGSNSFTGTFPSEIGRMTKLVTGGDWDGLVCSNKLTGPMPTELGQLDQMTYAMV